MSAVPLDTIFGEMTAEKENTNNTKPRSSTKKVPATLPEVQIEHRLTREMVKEMITEAIKGLKAEITPKMGDIAQSVVRIADALEEAEARGCFERMSLDEKEGPVIGSERQNEESEAPGSEVKNGEGQGAIERDPTQGGQKAEHQPNVSDCHARGRKFYRGGHRGGTHKNWSRGGGFHQHGSFVGGCSDTKAQARHFYNFRRNPNCVGPSTSSAACRCVQCADHSGHHRFRPYRR
ncbi:hypothetical protein niasHT_003335 [Heterodera trifolii]|uniref:Uncharacterized protein n=1 Tax=Heterodera trifolii TaxID=157864 RepID=A0ABD2LXU0_9BILA